MTEPSIDKVVEALLTDIAGEKQNAPYEVRVDILRMIITSWRERGEAVKDARAKAFDECEAIAREHADLAGDGNKRAAIIADAIAALWPKEERS